jgi:hypothetical protein
MAEIDFPSFIAAREHIFACDGTVDDALLDAIETVQQAAADAGSVTVEIRCVSRADRAGDKRTKFAKDIRYARALYDIAPWAIAVLMNRVRELTPPQRPTDTEEEKGHELR